MLWGCITFQIMQRLLCLKFFNCSLHNLNTMAVRLVSVWIWFILTDGDRLNIGMENIAHQRCDSMVKCLSFIFSHLQFYMNTLYSYIRIYAFVLKIIFDVLTVVLFKDWWRPVYHKYLTELNWTLLSCIYCILLLTNLPGDW